MTMPNAQKQDTQAGTLTPEESTNTPRIRNQGQLHGHLDALLPCLYLTQACGARNWHPDQRWTHTTPGLFSIVPRCAKDPVEDPVDGCTAVKVESRHGLVLPVHACRNPTTRTALQTIAKWLGDQRADTVCDRRKWIQEQLEAAFGGTLHLADREDLNGLFEINFSPDLFQQLNADFSYITGVIDNPKGHVQITATSRFDWRSYGELMEWYHCHYQDEYPLRVWGTFDLFFVSDPHLFPAWFNRRWIRAGLSRPLEDPSRWFVIRPGLHDANLLLRLEMDMYGWAFLHLGLDEITETIYLSEVYDPFERLIAWGYAIVLGDLPVQIEINTERCLVQLIALATDNPERILLRVTSQHPEHILLEGIVSRSVFTTALKTELLRFFTVEFDPDHWDGLEDDAGHLFSPLKNRALKHMWLST